MNIEAGVDADALQATLIERLAESGVDVDPEVLSALTEPLARIYAIPDHLHALAHMLGDGLCLQTPRTATLRACSLGGSCVWRMNSSWASRSRI